MANARSCFLGFCLSACLVLTGVPPAWAQNGSTTVCCRSTLEITASRSVQLLVTAPNGFETGFDPLSIGGFVNQIPSSSYTLGFSGNAAAVGEEASVERRLEIGAPAASRYLVQAIGASSGDFRIRFKAFGRKGVVTIREFRGRIRPGQTRVYSVRDPSGPEAKFRVVPFTPFADLSVNLEVAGAAPPSFQIAGNLDLGSASSGFDPLHQPVSIRLASYAVTIPAGSFVQASPGTYKFDGAIQGATIRSQITRKGAGRFAFRMTVRGIDMSAAINPVRVLLLLGGNAGSTSVNAITR